MTYCVSADPTVSRRNSPKSLQGRNATGPKLSSLEVAA
jgi:hypothetical protein